MIRPTCLITKAFLFALMTTKLLVGRSWKISLGNDRFYISSSSSDVIKLESMSNNILYGKRCHLQKSVGKKGDTIRHKLTMISAKTPILAAPFPSDRTNIWPVPSQTSLNNWNAKITVKSQECVTAWKKKQTLLWSASHWCPSSCYLTVSGYTELGGYFRVRSQIWGP